MPHVVAAVLIGAGVAAGMKWLAKEMSRASQAAREAAERMASNTPLKSMPKDLGYLEWDADAGVYRFDQLVVLRMTRMPAVLLEAGSIIHRDEELKLLAPERRALIMESVVDAVTSFCTLRSKTNTTIARTSKASPTAARTQRVKQDPSKR